VAPNAPLRSAVTALAAPPAEKQFFVAHVGPNAAHQFSGFL
jgi:hypothetical protein